MNATRLSFVVTGFGDDPSIVTDLLKLEPTRVWRRGEPIPGRRSPPVAQEVWAVESLISTEESVAAHFDWLLSELERCLVGAREVASRFEAHFSLYHHCSSFNTSFELPATLIRRAAAIGVGIEFDMYFMPADEPPTGENL